MAMNSALLKQQIKSMMTKEVKVQKVNPSDGSISYETIVAEPGEPILNIVEKILEHIITFAEINGMGGQLTFNASGGLGTGVGGGIPGPVTVSLTGVPVSGPVVSVQVPQGCIK